MAVTDEEISSSLLISTRDEAYPDSEEILTAELGPTSLAVSLHLAQGAKHEVETDLRTLGHQSSSDVDNWITRAKYLQDEIERSKLTARQIIRDYEHLQALSGKAQDAEAKLHLLQNETSFNQTLTSSLNEISSVDRELNDAESDLASGRIIELVANLDHLSSHTAQKTYGNAAEINRGRCSRIRVAVAEAITAAAESMVDVQESRGHKTVRFHHGKHTSLCMSCERMLQTLAKLGALEDVERGFARTIHAQLCEPVLSMASDAITCLIHERSQSLELFWQRGPKTVSVVLNCLVSIFRFLYSQFPAGFGSEIGKHLSDDVVDTLITVWLTPSIPLSLSDLQESHDWQARVTQLSELLKSYQWPGYSALAQWTNSLPRLWLERRCTASLDAVRKAMKAQRGSTREVERVERHSILDEGALVESDSTDEGMASPTQKSAETKTTSTEGFNAEEDLSAWDFGDDTEDDCNDEAAGSSKNGNSREVEKDELFAKAPVSLGGRAMDLPTNGSTQQGEVTLTESYHVTDLPDQLIEIIREDLDDAAQVKDSNYAGIGGSIVSSSMMELPGQVLAIFRAIAPASYTATILDGSMHLYNDCVYLVDRLRELATHRSLSQLRRQSHVLEKFARGAFAREIGIQRTILVDLMDGAQGFVRCTTSPYSEECEKAVTSTIDRLRTIYNGWGSILSRSALLQSVGSLLSTVMEKMMKAIEDLEDISDSESQRLTTLCCRFSALEDLFRPDQSDSLGERPIVETVPLTAVYVPHWLRFQYLSNILESSLADIKYLWTEGELGLEFTAEEVVDLIEALFAESQHRRNAIAEIRRSRVM